MSGSQGAAYGLRQSLDTIGAAIGPLIAGSIDVYFGAKFPSGVLAGNYSRDNSCVAINFWYQRTRLSSKKCPKSATVAKLAKFRSGLLGFVSRNLNLQSG